MVCSTATTLMLTVVVVRFVGSIVDASQSASSPIHFLPPFHTHSTSHLMMKMTMLAPYD